MRSPRVFGAKPGTITGTAKLVTASAGHRASYEWEYSTDGGKAWVTAPATLQAKTTVTGLTPGDDGAVPEPGGDQDRRRRLDPAGVARRAVAAAS